MAAFEPALECAPAAPVQGRQRGVGLTFDRVSVVASGHTLLDDIRLTIEPGSEVAIVGHSGAGKSSFVGTLLGWHDAANGRILVDAVPLDGASLGSLRRETAWVDPEVMLWNGSLHENLTYGAEGDVPGLAPIDDADLGRLLSRLPHGLSSELGEAGALIAGGEGQRVRLARALMRREARLVILDEPFRGLQREERQRLLERARARWRGATLLFVTHDVAQALGFERVLVMQKGRLVEDGRPGDLARRRDSVFAELLAAAEATRSELRGSSVWQRLMMEHGQISNVEASNAETSNERHEP
jgi:ATP-binding cassette subfamily B protein